ncbi:MAG: universal stress protein [Brevinematia bacterium]
MLRKLLFPVVFTEETEQIIGCIAGLAENGLKEVTLLHVISVSEVMENNYTGEKLEEELLFKWKKFLEEYGLKVEYKIITGIPWIEIVDMAEKKDFSFILIGSHGSSFLERVLLGSVTERVVQHSKKPILIYKLKKGKQNQGLFCIDIFKKILYCTDFSVSSERCIPYIESMLNNKDQELLILHVQDLRNLKHVDPAKIDEFNKIDLERLAKLKEHFEKVGYKKVMTLLTTGYSISEIMNYSVTEEPSIIVIGKKGKTNLKEMLLGGVSQTLIHRSNVSIFMVEEDSK